MAKVSTPGSGRKSASENADPATESDFRDDRKMRSKRRNKQKSVHEEQTSNVPTRNPKREHSDEKLEKEELKSRFSYVPKKRRTQVEAHSNDNMIGDTKLFSENSDHQINGAHKSTIRVEETDRKTFTPKSDFAINFYSSDVSITPAEAKILKSYRSLLYDSKNIMHYVTSISQGQNCRSCVKQVRKGPIVNHVAGMERFVHQSLFDRRVTALTFHPNYPSLMAAGSKGGEILLWDTNEMTPKIDIPGIGPGGSVLALKFHHENPMIVYTASLTGTVQRQDFLGVDNMTFFDTKDFETWFPSLDTSVPHKLIIAGDTQGYLHLANLDGKKLWKTKKKVHKGKVTHIEFSAWDPNIFVTASLDHTVRVWDLRMFSHDAKCYQSLHCLPHEKAVNSAYFSPSNGTSLLTTDQYNELRVYTAPLWYLEKTIAHPHRQFQHLTGIKAQWHPLDDLIVVGRYPDVNFCPNDLRTIDIYSAHTGKREYYFRSIGIVSLNAFSPNGDVLASASGTSIILWKSKEECKDSAMLSTAACQKLLQPRGVSRSRSNNSKKKLAPANLQKKQKSKH